MKMRAPERCSGPAEQADPFADELDAFLDPKRQSPKFQAAYEDATRRQEILDELVKCRVALGLTQTEVAKRMGVSQPTVSGFETESSDPRLSTLQRYARAVESTISFRMDLPASCDWVSKVKHPAYNAQVAQPYGSTTQVVRVTFIASGANSARHNFQPLEPTYSQQPVDSDRKFISA